MAAKKRDHSLNASFYSRPRRTAAEIADLKKRANKRKMLEAQMEGARELGKHWSGYIKKTERKRKATKAIKTAAEIAELAAGVPAIGKVVGKKVLKEAAKKASKKAVKITQDSKFAKRTADAAIKEIKEKGKKQRGVLVEKTTVKGGKATTPKLPKGAGGAKPRRSLPRSPNKPAGDAGKRVAKREQYYKEREALKKAAESNKKMEKFLKGSGAPKTSALKGKKDPFAALKGLDKKSAMKAIQGKIDQAKKRLEKLGVPKKDWPKKPTAKPTAKPKPKQHTWKDPDLQYMVNEINRKRKLPTRIEPWEITGKGKKLSPEELKKWNKKARNTPLPKRKKPGSGGKGRK